MGILQQLRATRTGERFPPVLTNSNKNVTKPEKGVPIKAWTKAAPLEGDPLPMISAASRFASFFTGQAEDERCAFMNKFERNRASNALLSGPAFG
jgi:hypothetical protein